MDFSRTNTRLNPEGIEATLVWVAPLDGSDGYFAKLLPRSYGDPAGKYFVFPEIWTDKGHWVVEESLYLAAYTFHGPVALAREMQCLA